MTFLSRSELNAALDCADIGFHPRSSAAVGPASLTLTLGTDMRVLADGGPVLADQPDTYPALNPRAPDEYGRIALYSREVMLAATGERVALGRGYCGWMSGTSDLARLGIQVVLSHFVAPGFSLGAPGVLVLELTNFSPREIRFRPGMRVAHLAIARLGIPAESGYEAVKDGYAGADGVIGSRLHTRGSTAGRL